MHNIKYITIVALLGTSTPAVAQAQSNRSESRPGWLGIRFQCSLVNQEGRSRVTVDVAEVVAGSPAARSGLQPGDRIVTINGQALPPGNCTVISRALKSGETVRLKLQRAGDTRDYTIIAAERPLRYPVLTPFSTSERFIVSAFPDSVWRVMRMFFDSAGIHPDTSLLTDSIFFGRGMRYPRLLFTPGQAPRNTQRRFELHLSDPLFDFPRFELLGRNSVAGAIFTEMNPRLVAALQTAAEYLGPTNGLLLTEVAPGTPAARAGLQPGDVITQVAGQDIRDIQTFRDLVRRQTGRPLELEIVRKGKTQKLELDARPGRRD